MIDPWDSEKFDPLAKPGEDSFPSLWRRIDNGEIAFFHQFPAGAMYYASWHPEWPGPDGKCLAVRLPDGSDWNIDGPTYKDGKQGDRVWKRTGTPPDVTVTPSIDIKDGLTGGSRYHGVLTSGVLKAV
jgi:hypothetical protein